MKLATDALAALADPRQLRLKIDVWHATVQSHRPVLGARAQRLGAQHAGETRKIGMQMET